MAEPILAFQGPLTYHQKLMGKAWCKTDATCPRRICHKEPFSEDIKKIAVAAIVSDNESRILLLKRKKGSFLSSLYELPGGVADDGERLCDAVIREVKEEARMEVTAVVGPIAHFDFTSRRGFRMRRFGFIAGAKGIPTINSDDHEGFAWVRKESISLLELTDNARRVLEAYLHASIK